MVKKKKSDGVDILQPVMNIGMVGHVDHGKTTLLERLSGKWTDTHSEELKRGITIRLGYADVVIRKRKDGSFTTEDEEETEISRKVSFVDAPGHESLMATMLSGATLMDGALLLVAANEQCPQPQTREHIMALEIIGLKNIVVVQNKIDLVNEEQALKNYEQIKAFLKGTIYENAPIIPLSAQHKIGIGHLLTAIEKTISTPNRDPSKTPIMFVARSFDVNKPGADIPTMVGGVLGGGLKQGSFKIGDSIEIRPGYMVVEKNQQIFKSLKSTIVGLNTGGVQVETVGPGGSIGVLTALDPSIVKSDKLAGAICGYPGSLPPVWYDLTLKITLLERVVGVEEKLAVDPVKMGEPLMLNVNSAATVGIVNDMKKGLVKCKLKLPVCADAGSRMTVSRRIGNRFR
ncbi:MAG: translation initiation factor IF-2 subunit gamma, partial [Omnitrophica WOR_2 bacterium GWA2_47_8]